MAGDARWRGDLCSHIASPHVSLLAAWLIFSREVGLARAMLGEEGCISPARRGRC
jgi:hypothetical protein